eukprot:9110922-Pyramimonas_sp.AAC.1
MAGMAATHTEMRPPISQTQKLLSSPPNPNSLTATGGGSGVHTQWGVEGFALSRLWGLIL